MTYLQLVNGVLKRMRETEVSTVSATDYSTMIGALVNDAKELVENAWDWSALYDTITVTTSADVFNYALTDSKQNHELMTFVNDTSNLFMAYREQAWMDQRFLNQEAPTGIPRYYSYNVVDSNGDSTIDIYPIPDGEYDLRYNCIKRQAELSDDSDALKVPPLPVLHLAHAMAVRERGESDGTSTAEYFRLASQMLGDAIAIDALRKPEDLVMKVV